MNTDQFRRLSDDHALVQVKKMAQNGSYQYHVDQDVSDCKESPTLTLNNSSLAKDVCHDVDAVLSKYRTDPLLDVEGLTLVDDSFTMAQAQGQLYCA